MKSLTRSATTAITALLLSLFIGMPAVVESAHADATVTKTINVKNSSGAALAGALVAVGYPDNSPIGWHWTDPQTTDSQGQVVVTSLPASSGQAELYVEPAESDATDAFGFASHDMGNFSLESTTVVNIQLHAATLRVNLKQSNGDPAPVHTWLSYPNDSSQQMWSAPNTLRTGSFGLYLDPSLNCDTNDGNWSIQFGAPAFDPASLDSDFTNYNMIASGCPSRTLTFKNVRGVTATNTGGIWQLSFNHRAFNFAVVSPTDSSTTLTRVGAWLEACVTIDGNDNCTNVAGGAKGGLGLPDGDYKLRVHPGSTPYAMKLYSLTISGGGTSYSAKVGYPATLQSPSVPVLNGKLVFAAALPNLTIHAISPADGSALSNGVPIQIFDYTNQQQGSQPFYNDWAQTGSASFALDNGEYLFFLGNDNYPEFAQTRFDVIVTGGVAVVKDLSGNTISPASGSSFNLALGTANFKYRVLSPLNQSPLSNIYVDACPSQGGGNCTGGYLGGNNSYASMHIPDGTWTVRTHADNYPQFAEKDYTVVVSGGHISSISPNVTPDGDGIYSLTFSTANFHLKIVSPTDNTSPVQGYFDYCTDLGNGRIGNCNGTGVGPAGTGAASLANGNWIVRVHPDNNHPQFAEADYTFTVSNGTVSITNSSITADGNGVFLLPVSVPNISGSITAPGGGAITYGNGIGVSVNLQTYNGNNWNYVGQGTWAQGTYSMNVTTPGTYRLIYEPQGLPQYASAYSPQFTVNSDKSVTVSGGGSATNLNVSLNTPNLKFKVRNPLDNSLLPFGNLQFQKVINQYNTQWAGNANLNPSTPGLTSITLEDGTYQVTVYPPNGSQSIPGLAPYMYTATVSGSTVTLLDGTTPVVADTSGVFTVQPASANITGHIVDATGASVGSSNGVWVNVGVQQLQNGVNWNWMNLNSQVDQDGYFGIFLKDPGTYRLRIQPSGRNDVSTTFSDQFTITADGASSFKQNFPAIKLPAPNLQVQVAGATTPDQNINIDIQSNNRWVDNIWIDQSGSGATNLTTAGTYQLTVHPNAADVAAGKAQKQYVATVTNNNGVFDVAIAGLTATNGVFTLPLGTATLSGHVYAPSDTTPVWNAQVVPVDQATGNELWQYSTGTDSNGNWSMALPAGTYKVYARAPGGDATVADSAKSSSFTVDNSGTATGISTPVDIHLKNPKWSGVLKSPDSSTAIAYGTVCLNYQSGESFYNSCQQTDNQGRWAFAGPDGAFSFDATASLRANENVSPQFGSLLLTQTGLNAQLGSGGSNIVLNLPIANVTVHVIDASGAAAQNVWVNIDRDNVGWLGAATTDQNGNAHLNVSDLTKGINVQVDVNSNPAVAAKYTGTRRVFTDSYVNANATGSPKTITLNATLPLPNVAGIVHDPSTNSIAPYTWVDIFDSSKNQWMGGSGTNQDGYFSLNAPAPASGVEHYVIGVNPSGQSGSLSARKTYSLDVASDNSITLKDDATHSAPTTEPYNGVNVTYFSLALPSVSGVVKDDAGANEPFAWVQPYNVLTSQWMNGYGVRQNGQFGLALDNGQYRLQANPTSQASGQAPSDYCYVTIAGGAVTTNAGGCVQNDKTVILALRPPNFHITVHTPQGDALPYANVGVCIASWCTNAQADASGVASLFIDKNAILAASNYLTSSSPNQIMTLWIDPPYGTSSVVRTQCQSGQSGTACQSLPQVSMSANFNDYSATFTMKGPNVHATILDPSGGALGTNYWATLYSLDSNHNRQWIGNGGTDSSGNVSFLVDTTTVTRVVLEVDVPNTPDQTFANTIWDNNGNGFDPADLASATLKLATPNLRITSLALNSITQTIDTNTYGWAMLETYNNTTHQPISWVTGFGLNDQGQAAVNLAASTTYRLTVFPGPNKSGAGTTCILQTSAGASPTVSKVPDGCPTGTLSAPNLSITLSNGNVNGTVKDPNDNPVKGAIVTAQVGSDTSTTIVSSTDTNGTFGLNLDLSRNWTIKVIPFNPVTGTQLAIWSSAAAGTPVGQGMAIKLTVAP